MLSCISPSVDCTGMGHDPYVLHDPGRSERRPARRVPGAAREPEGCEGRGRRRARRAARRVFCPGPVWTTDETLFGRQQDISVLEAFVEQAVDDGGALLVTGEAGVGKT